nr:MAG TPA: hypothetical protein [Caudoviricetes sp.]
MSSMKLLLQKNKNQIQNLKKRVIRRLLLQVKEIRKMI